MPSALERMARPQAEVSSAQQLQPLADALAAARRHTEDLGVALQAGVAADGDEAGEGADHTHTHMATAVEGAPAAGATAVGANNARTKLLGKEADMDFRRAPAEAAASVARWLEAVVDRAAAELTAAEVRQRSACPRAQPPRKPFETLQFRTRAALKPASLVGPFGHPAFV
jgi:hypothetical protein